MYLFLSVGVNLHFHHCGGELKEVTLTSMKGKDCDFCSKPETPACCSKKKMSCCSKPVETEYESAKGHCCDFDSEFISSVNTSSFSYVDALQLESIMPFILVVVGMDVSDVDGLSYTIEDKEGPPDPISLREFKYSQLVLYS